MSIPGEAYLALEAILGSENISDDPAICEADTKGGFGEFLLDKNAVRPACVVLPRSTQQVRDVVRLANRYCLPFIPFSTFFSAYCAPNRANTIAMDLKMMNRLEIDEKNMFAICEPGVSVSQLQAEAWKRGLYTLTPGCGAQASVVANTAVNGMGPAGYRLGFACRRILGTEWVLPDGEVLDLGSTAVGKDWFFGEGPGPDLRGILRGLTGHQGGLGVVTRMAVKLFPFIPERPEPVGISPNTTLNLPANRMKWYNLTYPTIEKTIDAMYEIAAHEIGAMVLTIPPVFRFVARARGKGANAFWEAWNSADHTLDKDETTVRVLLLGYTSEKQLAYEEKVLKDIAAETGGVAREGRPTDESWFMAADSISIYFIGGGEMSVEMSFDSLDHSLKVGKETAELKKKYTPPLTDDFGAPGWFQIQEMGHFGYQEFLTYTDAEDMGVMEKLVGDCLQNDIRIGAYPAIQEPGLLGPVWHNYHQILGKVKQAFDPRNLSNPPKPLSYF